MRGDKFVNDVNLNFGKRLKKVYFLSIEQEENSRDLRDGIFIFPQKINASLNLTLI